MRKDPRLQQLSLDLDRRIADALAKWDHACIRCCYEVAGENGTWLLFDTGSMSARKSPLMSLVEGRGFATGTTGDENGGNPTVAELSLSEDLSRSDSTDSGSA